MEAAHDTLLSLQGSPTLAPAAVLTAAAAAASSSSTSSSTDIGYWWCWKPKTCVNAKFALIKKYQQTPSFVVVVVVVVVIY